MLKEKYFLQRKKVCRFLPSSEDQISCIAELAILEIQ